VFTLNQNRCSRWARITVHVEPEYAGPINILNLASYEDKIAAKIQVDEEQVIFDF